MVRKPKVKLLTLWMLDRKYENRFEKNISEDYISNGIWETRAVEEKSKTKRIYTLTCVNSHHKDLKIGTEIKMDEIMIVELCHRVKLVSLPKYKSLLKQNQILQ